MRLFPLAFMALMLASCNTPAKDPAPQIELPSGKTVQLSLAVSPKMQEQGLSGVKDADFGANEGMLFVYPQDGPRRFWMPDTYFPLDIVFLSQDLVVVDIERDVPSHPGRGEPPAIPTTRTIHARHVLEMRADSPLTDEITIGAQLKWIAPFPLSGKVPDIRLRQ